MAYMVLCFVGILVVGMILVVGFRILNFVWLRPKKMEKYLREQGFNGTPYKLLFGDLKEMMAMSDEAKSKPIRLSDDIVPRVMPFLHKSLNDYGKNFYTWIGPRPLIHIMDPNLIKDILSKYDLFQKPRGGNPLGKLLATGLADADGEEWAKRRKIINPAFHVEKLKHMVPAFYLSCSDMINKWDKLVPSEGSCEVDVWPHLQTLTSDVISRTAFGSSYEEGRKIFELQKEQAELIIKTVQSIYVPGFRFLPTKRNRRMKEIAKEVKASIRKMIDKRMVAVKSGEMNNDDLLSILLESNYKEIQPAGSGNYGMSIEDVIEECKLFYFAGQETTSTLLVWTMILLAHHSSWQERARNEVLQFFGKSKPDVDGLNRLKIMTMIFNEVLRLYPPGAVMGRMIHEETKLGEKTLPAGAFFNLHMMILHRDTEIWGNDANEFNPERFTEGISKVTKGQGAYFPFGGGPRICIGQNFALLEAKMALAMILQRFSFTLSPSYSHAPFTILILQPQHGAPLILNKL